MGVLIVVRCDLTKAVRPRCVHELHFDWSSVSAYSLGCALTLSAEVLFVLVGEGVVLRKQYNVPVYQRGFAYLRVAKHEELHQVVAV